MIRNNIKLTEEDFREFDDDEYLIAVCSTDKSKQIKQQILENQEFREKFEQYMDKNLLEEFGIDTVVCSKQVFETNRDIVERLREWYNKTFTDEMKSYREDKSVFQSILGDKE